MEVLSNGLPAKLLLLLLTVVMSTNMSGCRGTADAADTSQPPGVVAEQTDDKISSAQTSKSTVQQSDEATNSKKPEPIMIDNVADLIQINGKTITMPTTLNTLSECIDGSSYEVTPEFLDDFKSEKGILDEFGKLFCVLKKNDETIFSTFIMEDDYTKELGDCEIKHLTYNPKVFSENSLTFSMSCGIDFSSTRKDIIDILGEPNMRTTDTYLKYYLLDSNNNPCILTFNFRFESDEMASIIYNGIV